MAFNGSGTFTPAAGYPAVSGTTATASDRNTIDADFASGLSNCITKDGQTTVTANIPLGSNKITGLANGTASTDAANLANIQAATGVYVGTVGGTADVITLTPSPAITAYAAGQMFSFIASGANTTNVTVNVSGLGAKAITKNGATALVANDILSSQIVTIRYDGTRFQVVGRLDAALYFPIAGGTITGSTTIQDSHLLIDGGSGDLTFDASGLSADRALVVQDKALTIAGIADIPKVIGGLVISNNGTDASNDINISTGACLDSTNVELMTLSSAITKRMDAAWDVGTGNGGLDGTESVPGTPDTSTWYYVWLIKRSDTGVVDVLFSESATSPTMPTNYDYKRLIGAVYRNSGGTNDAFTADETAGGGLRIWWTTPTLDVDLTNTLTTTLRTDVIHVPTAFSTLALVRVYAVDAAGFVMTLYHANETDAAPSATATPLISRAVPTATAAVGGAEHWVKTTSAGAVRARATGTVDSYRVLTVAFEMERR